jgi:hypothetical protein
MTIISASSGVRNEIFQFLPRHLFPPAAVTWPWPRRVKEAHFLGNACSGGNRAVWELHRAHRNERGSTTRLLICLASLPSASDSCVQSSPSPILVLLLLLYIVFSFPPVFSSFLLHFYLLFVHPLASFLFVTFFFLSSHSTLTSFSFSYFLSFFPFFYYRSNSFHISNFLSTFTFLFSSSYSCFHQSHFSLILYTLIYDIHIFFLYVPFSSILSLLFSVVPFLCPCFSLHFHPPHYSIHHFYYSISILHFYPFHHFPSCNSSPLYSILILVLSPFIVFLFV